MQNRLGTDKNRLPTLTMWIVGGMIGGFFFVFLGDIFIKGVPQLSVQFLTVAPLDAGRQGGIGPIIISTGLILLVCMGVSFPIALGVAAFLAEFTTSAHLLRRITRRSLDVLAGIPSIVFGLFGNVFFCQILGLGFSILAGGLTLACMVLPILIRTTEEGFRAVPNDYRLSAAALALSQRTTLWHLLLPAATPALLVGFILGLGRAIAETAALIFTSGYVDRMPESVFDSGRAISIHIYDLSMNIPGGDHNAYATAVTLVIFLFLLNSLSTWVSQYWVHRRIMFI